MVVLIHGARAPFVIRREQLGLIKPFEVDEITHYRVANMPGAVPVHTGLFEALGERAAA